MFSSPTPRFSHSNSGSPTSMQKSASPDDIQAIIDMILGDNELKEFFHDLIINEGTVTTKPMSQPRMEIKQEFSDNKFSLPFKNERLMSSSGSRKFGQTLFPLFFNHSRATTASTSAIRKRGKSFSFKINYFYLLP